MAVERAIFEHRTAAHNWSFRTIGCKSLISQLLEAEWSVGQLKCEEMTLKFLRTTVICRIYGIF